MTKRLRKRVKIGRRIGRLYMITFPNGKRYIGVTHRSVRTRIYEHTYGAEKNPNSSFLRRAIHKHGIAEWHVLVVGKMSYLKSCEVRAIAVFKTRRPFGYNVSLGGDIPYISEETRVKMSVAARLRSKEPAWRENLSRKLTGRVFDQEWRDKIAATLRGRKHTEATKLKMSVSQRARPPNVGPSPLKGVPRSQEVKAKVSEGLREYHAFRQGIRDNA